MIRLLKIEFHKILFSRTFWIILGLYIALLAPIAFGFDNILKAFSINNDKQPSLSSFMLQGYSVFNFPGVWNNMAYIASWFKLFLVIIIVLLVCNEYSNKTLRQNIIDGMSKWEIIWAKELVILIISIIAVVILILLTLILGHSQNNVSLFSGSSIVLAYFISLLLYLNLAYFLSSLLKKSGFVVGVLLLYSIVIENLISYLLPNVVLRFLPMNLISNMVPNPLGNLIGQNAESDFSVLNVGVCGLYIMLFIMINYWLLKKGHAGKQV